MVKSMRVRDSPMLVSRKMILFNPTVISRCALCLPLPFLSTVKEKKELYSTEKSTIL